MANPVTSTLFQRNWRKRLVGSLAGNVLEIGAGSGPNFVLYPAAAHVWAIEPNSESVLTAAAQVRQSTAAIMLYVAAAEALPFPDASFDHIVSSLVFCSVADPLAAAGELRRVLKPGGALHMVEHVRPTTAWLAAFFQAATPLWSRYADNCHLDRPTVDTLRTAGWEVLVHRRRFMVVRLSAHDPQPASD